jgi:hypothetical protein
VKIFLSCCILHSVGVLGALGLQYPGKKNCIIYGFLVIYHTSLRFKSLFHHVRLLSGLRGRRSSAYNACDGWSS